MADAVSFHFNRSFAGWISLKTDGDALQLYQEWRGLEEGSEYDRVHQTIHVPPERWNAFWQEMDRLDGWRWPYDSLPGGCDGSSFTVSVQHDGRSVQTGWWLGQKWGPLLELCGALERLTMWQFVHVMRRDAAAS
jgi:hypothetical protein